MPVRAATRRDIPIMAQVVAASFGPDPLFQVCFPHQNEYWSDFERAIRDSLWLAWYDYRKVLMVSYPGSDNDDDVTPSSPQSKAAVSDEETALLRPPTSKREIITGVAEWERAGRGWERVHGAWGAWDPRLLVKPVLTLYYSLRRRIVGNRAAAAAATATATVFSSRKNSTDPPPLTFWNFYEQVGPYVAQFFSAPHRQTRWSLEILAVHPNEQGKGYGRELVADGLERLAKNDAEGELPVSVVAANGKETFYEKVGFKELVGWVSRTVGEDGSDNPMRRNGVPGGAVLWTR